MSFAPDVFDDFQYACDLAMSYDGDRIVCVDADWELVDALHVAYAFMAGMLHAIKAYPNDNQRQVDYALAASTLALPSASSLLQAAARPVEKLSISASTSAFTSLALRS